MKTKFSLMVIFLASTYIAGAEDHFTIKSVRSDIRPDSVVLRIHGEGVPVFSTYELHDPPRIMLRIQNGRLDGQPVEMSYSLPVKRLRLQPDFAEQTAMTLVCEIDGAGGFTAREGENSIYLAVHISGRKPGIIRNDPPEKPGWMYNSVNIDFDATPLVSALTLMARQNGFDVVLSQLTDQKVTAHLSDVTVAEALDAMLSATGFSYVTIGDIVVVKEMSGETAAEMVTKVFKLNYLDSRLIEQQVKNMLSPDGKVHVVAAGRDRGENGTSNYPSNVIAVTDKAGVIPLVEEFINRIDTKPRQIAISVKLVETNLNDNQAFGFDWETSLTSKITDAQAGNSFNDPNVERLSAFSTLPLEAGSFTYGTLTFSELSLLLEYLKTSDQSRLLSSPSVTTTDGKPAVIDVVTTIPIQTVNRFSEGAVIQDIVTFQYKDVGITLDVTPIINSDGYITLKCKPTVEEITGWVGPNDNQQPITAKRSVDTDVIVKSGETLVIGGLMKESTIENVSGVWLLSDIPVLGELFKHRSRQSAKTDLMILITPSIIP